jgi:AraC family transcriptional regulator
MQARKDQGPLKTYPKLSFKLTIRGVVEMEFRIVKKEAFKIIGLKGTSTSIAEGESTLDPLWTKFMDRYDGRLYNGGGKNNYYSQPLWQVGAYWNKSDQGQTPCIIGAELGDKPALEGMDIDQIPEAAWVVFTINSPAGTGHDEAYARIQTEWFPTSHYRRMLDLPNLEVYPAGNGSSKVYKWEIWMPVIEK